MIMYILSAILLLLNVFIIALLLRKKNDHATAELSSLREDIGRLEKIIREECRYLLENHSKTARENREELAKSLGAFRTENAESLKHIAEQNFQSLETVRRTLDSSFQEFRKIFTENIQSFNELQREKFGELNKKQSELLQSTEKRLDEMRSTVDEKLQKTLNERIGQSFEMVSKQLEHVQKGLGEMQSLAQDVGGLKKVLGNVKMRGCIGEVQLEMLLEQILAPEQYEANVKTRKGSDTLVEFAIKLPGKDDSGNCVYLPIDAKFPKDAYEQLQNAYDSGDTSELDAASRNIEQTIKAMAKDIHDKYLDPPYTTDFGIMFLPFESIYGEVVRRASLLEQLQRDYKVIVTGPTTLAAILNSLQMGFRTLAIQKRSSEVWKVLGAVKTEFEKFGGMLEKAQKNIQTANNQIEEVMGKRTRAIQRHLRNVEALPQSESELLIPIGQEDLPEEEN
ncbi:DNA recombination protein RmuC [uncultured Culturomica sp.]|jgi:DNA recombination protein RmuC|uniref:DNA recombination protein RmuC n=1 Tax=uncultured Culturomica sp. TaxID=1926654 RepID=UPI00259964CF|nr:DNA recombination protein RmuC [uncultured Culturomica sp.]